MITIEEDIKYGPITISKDEPILPSGVVCRILDVPIWALTMLDQEKVVSPDRERYKGRLYSINDLKLINKCWYLVTTYKIKIRSLKIVLKDKDFNV